MSEVFRREYLHRRERKSLSGLERVNRIMNVMNQYVVKTPDVCGGRARLEGRRVRVQDIACYSEWWGWRADQIASELEITLAQVHGALAYYFENIEEIREDLRAENEFFENSKAQSVSKIATKLGHDQVKKPKSA